MSTCFRNRIYWILLFVSENRGSIMQYDVFISYAWGSSKDTSHREWVRLLAANLRQIGFVIGIDAKVDYGEDLTGFMRKISKAKHVLMVVDEGYVERADHHSDSGVGCETREIREVIDHKPGNWLSVLFVRNERCRLPQWMEGRNPKYFDFNYYPEKDAFPGSEQIDDLWRWIVGLPADKEHAVSPATIRKRMYRVERIDNLRDPSNWAFPELEGCGMTSRYKEAPSNAIVLGYGTYEFMVMLSSTGGTSVYVYNDYIQAVGVIPEGASGDDLSADVVAANTLGVRAVTLDVGQRVALMNATGSVCVMKLVDARDESHVEEYVPAQIVFDYKIFGEEDE